MNKVIDRPRLWIVIPCFNEQDVLPVTAPMFRDKLLELIKAGSISEDSRVLFVNDGSSDKTWQIITDLAAEDEHYIGISQSRNRGHQSTLLAGLMEAKDKCDITISIDCDGQDDINAMNEMVAKYHEGCEIVYGVRSSRKTDTWFKRNTAQTYYKLLNSMGANTVYNHADYRLVSCRVLAHFADYEEVNIFLRGMFPLVGFKSTSVEYERAERLAGKSHYPLSKMIKLAVEGITSLSTKPISIITGIGLFTVLLGIIGIIWAIVMVILQKTVAGWASLACIILFMGGVQLLSLGIIGEYIGKIYLETKHRPRYIISDRTWDEEEG
ncbi:Glycosyltransferase involved in cell wall bisynthesis [Ruminococcaceae bacterium YRB3002]|nr:Glycosyltransferase involved in cell wall bisynthesis [Ruminococcaceae bacterium YRB3002]